MKVLAIGDNCIDLYRELGKKYPGGNALNVAVYASRIDGIQADYIGVVGRDENGDFIHDQMKKQGLSTDNLLRWEGETSVTTILIRDGDRVFDDYLEGVQEDARFPSKLVEQTLGFDLVHFTIWGFGRDIVAELRNRGEVLLSCDFSSQLDDPRTGIMKHLDYCFFSGSHINKEGAHLEEKIKELKERTPGTVVMTLGEYGSIAYDSETLYKCSAPPVKVVDTLGAGDAYIASFLCSRIKGRNIEDSMKEGHKAATEICKRLGAWGGDSA
ncbi:MAG: fructoselysine 6-kinase [Candidatus Bathyarchaeota archaeon]|nr:fructoselysine 6-kinase [Candidatus Bathyarchaeota archaeon]